MQGSNSVRLMKELESLRQSTPPGISCWPEDSDNLLRWTASIEGPEKSPYEGGLFLVGITIPERYPFEPPVMQFKTRIYHCNIDEAGRICLDLLKMPPKGQWKPSLNLSTLLLSLQVLLGDPNPDDPLNDEIAREFKTNYPEYLKKAKMFTEEYAKDPGNSVDHQRETVSHESPTKSVSLDQNKENKTVRDEDYPEKRIKVVESEPKTSKMNKLSKRRQSST